MLDEQAFLPHVFGPDEHFVDLFHVYDNLSQTPYQRGIGIECSDPDRYIMNSWHVITPEALRNHSDWKYRGRTQFISFYGKLESAQKEAQRRRKQEYIPGGGRRDPDSVRIAHVRLFRGTKVWFFSRDQMLRMMQCFGWNAAYQMTTCSHPDEWYVYGDVPDEHVQNRNDL